MKKFRIKVNGVSYEVEVEEAGAAAPAAPAAPVAAAAPAVPAAPVAAEDDAPAPTPTAEPVAGALVISAPMPGTLLSFKVSEGQAVKQNDVLCILEAMKMENEIVAPRDGVVAGIHSTAGSSVNAGDNLVSLS